MVILGVHLDFPFIHMALLNKGRRGIEVQSLKTALCDQPETEALSGGPHSKALSGAPYSNVKRLYTTKRIVSGISAKNFLMRSIELKMGSLRHVEEVVAFQSEATSHFNPAEIMTVPLIQKGQTEILLFTVIREGLKNHLLQLGKLGIDPDAVSAIPLALCHFVRWKFPHLADGWIVDLGSSETTCVWMEKGRLKKAHAIAGGVEALLLGLFEDRKKNLLKKEIEGAAKQIDLLLLKSGLNPHLSAQLTELRQEIAKIFYSFGRGENRPLVFTGRTDAFIHLREFLSDSTENRWPLTLEEQKFGVSIGLALEQMTARPLQLRREEFFSRENWRRMGLYAVFLIAASFLLGGALFGLAAFSSHSRKKEMVRSLEVSSKKKFFGEGSIEEKIDQWIGIIEKNSREYPYMLQAPKVCEVLSWLSSHPLLEELKKEGDLIDLRQLRYQLVSFPKADSPKEPYLAKVEIEFQFKSGMNARKFHEALLRGDDRVNPNLEITWDTLNDGYRSSFFLKNRGPYVP